MARLLLLTNDLAPSAEVVPALGLLGHPVRTLPADASALLDSPDTDVVLVDARRELPQARSLCRVIRATGTSAPVIAVLTEGGLIAVTAEWSVDDVVLDTAGPAEVDARLEPAIRSSSINAQAEIIASGAGCGILPCFIGDAMPGLVRVLPEAVDIQRSFWLVVPRDLRGIARIDQFVGWLVATSERLRPVMLGVG